MVILSNGNTTFKYDNFREFIVSNDRKCSMSVL